MLPPKSSRAWLLLLPSMATAKTRVGGYDDEQKETAKTEGFENGREKVCEDPSSRERENVEQRRDGGNCLLCSCCGVDGSVRARVRSQQKR